MLAFLQYLIAWLVVVDAQGSAGPWDPGGALTAVAVFAGIVFVLGRIAEASVRAAQDERVRLGRAALAADAGRVGALVASWFLLSRHGCVHLPDALGVGAWPVAPHLVRLLPFFVCSAIVRTAVHGAAAAADAAPPELRRALVLDARMALLPLGPVVLFAASVDVLVRLGVSVVPTVAVLLLLGLSVVALLVLPAILRHAWRCRPLPPGPLRSRLEAYAARVGFRAREILLWPTGNEHLNAAVVGIAPRARYVFLTDALVSTLSDDEIEAVFAHEAGHARRGHMLLFFGYTSLLMLAAFLPGTVIGPLEDLVAPVPPLLRGVGLVLLWLGVAFGWLSRRFEQEADVFGIETLRASGGSAADPLAPHPFASALERIAAQGHGVREVTGWRHFSIADRVEFVRAYLADVAVRRRYRRNILLVRGALIAAVAVTGTFTLLRARFELGESPKQQMLQELRNASLARETEPRAVHLARAADAARRLGRTDDALRWYEEAARLGAPPDALRAWAEMLEASGRPLGAEAARGR